MQSDSEMRKFYVGVVMSFLAAPGNDEKQLGNAEVLRRRLKNRG